MRATGIDRVIAESAVTKETFYCQFPSKNELVRALLECQNERAWFDEVLERHGARNGAGLNALMPALAK